MESMYKEVVDATLFLLAVGKTLLYTGLILVPVVLGVNAWLQARATTNRNR